MKLRKGDHMLVETFKKDVLIFDTSRNVPHILSSFAYRILNRMDGNTSDEEIAQKVCQEYVVDYERALSDIKALEKYFIEKGLAHSEIRG